MGRGSFPRCFHGRQRCGDVGQGYLVGAQRGGRQGWKEEVRWRCVQLCLQAVAERSCCLRILSVQPNFVVQCDILSLLAMFIPSPCTCMKKRKKFVNQKKKKKKS